MTDNALQKEEGLFGRLPSSRYSSFKNHIFKIAIKDVCIRDCILILNGLNRFFDLSIVSITKRGDNAK
jgi:hypothetical protein